MKKAAYHRGPDFKKWRTDPPHDDIRQNDTQYTDLFATLSISNTFYNDTRHQNTLYPLQLC
jgi:hypothetical protein